MGSTGSGSFANYKTTKGDDQCFNDINNVNLEDIGRLSYYTKNKDVPLMFESIYVMNSLHNNRIAVKHEDSDLVLGYIPTKYNYLLSCLQKGIKYSGHIVFSQNNPLPRVSVNINAIQGE